MDVTELCEGCHRLPGLPSTVSTGAFLCLVGCFSPYPIRHISVPLSLSVSRSFSWYFAASQDLSFLFPFGNTEWVIATLRKLDRDSQIGDRPRTLIEEEITYWLVTKGEQIGKPQKGRPLARSLEPNADKKMMPENGRKIP